MTQFDAQVLQVGFGDVEQGVPRVETFLDKDIEVLGESELTQLLLQGRFRHGVRKLDDFHALMGWPLR